MHLFYSIYGLKLSSNLLIPGLAAIPDTSAVDVEVSLGFLPSRLKEVTEEQQQIWYVSARPHHSEKPVLTVWKIRDADCFRLLYSDDTEFVVSSDGAKVWAIWPDTLSLEDTIIYLEGPVMGFLLRLRGVTCLHASSIVINQQAVALVGPAGAGKSTTAAQFARLGFPVLSEDVVALAEAGDHFLVQPAYPRVRLWPSSVNTLCGSPDALPLLTPTWDKRYLDLTESRYRFQEKPLPLAAIYILDQRTYDSRAPYVEEVAAHTGLMTLVANSYTNYMLGREIRAQEFELLGRLVARVPVRRATPHADPAFLTALCDTIITDFQTHGITAPALAG